MEKFVNAGPGLRKMFIAALGSVICSVVSIIPVIGMIASIGTLVFAILSMVGLYQTGKDIQKCMTAFYVTIANIVVSIIKVFLSLTIFGSILSIVGTVLSLLVTYLVCTSVADVMNQVGAAATAQKGHTVWMINLVCSIVSIVISILALIPVLNLIAAFTSIIIVIVSLVATIMYMLFLNDSAKALGA